MSGPMNPVFQQLNQPHVERCTFHTPIQNFELKFDHLHQHRYPDLHNGNQYGARLNHIDLDTGKRSTLGHFELNSNIL